MTPPGPLPPKTRGFHHHAIKVADLARAEAFYVGVLGLVELARWPYPAGAGRQGLRALWLRTDPVSPAGFLALEQAEHALPDQPERRPSDDGHFLFALAIAAQDRQAWREHLRAAGFPVTHETAFTLYVADPEGNRLGLSHHPEPASGSRSP